MRARPAHASAAAGAPRIGGMAAPFGWRYRSTAVRVSSALEPETAIVREETTSEIATSARYGFMYPTSRIISRPS